MQITLSQIAFQYASQSDPLFKDITVTFPTGWSAITGDNGIGKTTLSQLLCGKLQPTQGIIQPNPNTLVIAYCAQQTDVIPENIDEFAADWSPETMRIRQILGIDESWLYRFSTLSGGQAKRVQIACALQQSPDLLILDEPTNHVDQATQQAIVQALKDFRGIGIAISHDIAFIDAVCDRCISFERIHKNGSIQTQVITRQGGYTQSEQQRQHDYRTAALHLKQSHHEAQRLHNVQVQRARKVQAATQSSKVTLDRKDHDARNARKMAKSSSLDSGVSRSLAQIKKRAEQANQAVTGIATAAKRYQGNFWVNSEPSHVREIMHLPEGIIRPGTTCVESLSTLMGSEILSQLCIDGNRWNLVSDEKTVNHTSTSYESLAAVDAIHIPEISMSARDHIILTGNNGLGKTSLIRAIQSAIHPLVQALIIAQNTTDEDAYVALTHLHELPKEQHSQVLSAYAQLNANPDMLTTGGLPSPGELRKLLLALAVVDKVQFIIMDEPTNHLDIASKNALARALRDFTGAYIIVSHDAAFLAQLTE